MRLLTIAEGTPYAITVWDVRDVYWGCEPTGQRPDGARYPIIYHHTADAMVPRAADDQLAVMHRMAESDQFGLPYNFLEFPGDYPRVWYLNDVDACWPHTLNFNCGTAIALQGNYETMHAPAGAVTRMWRLTKALESMWGQTLMHFGHRDVGATLCPGRNLYNALRAFGLLGK